MSRDWDRRTTGVCLSTGCRAVATDRRRWCSEHSEILTRCREELSGTSNRKGRMPQPKPPTPVEAPKPRQRVPVPERAAALARHIHEVGQASREDSAKAVGMAPGGSITRAATYAAEQGWITFARGVGWCRGPVEPPEAN